MTTKTTVATLDPVFDREALDGFLRTLPVHVLLFDRQLVCRYAAPDGAHFLGTWSDELLGRPLETIFPGTIELRPQLERVLQTSQPWRGDHVPYPSDPDGAWQAGAWTVHARAAGIYDHRGRTARHVAEVDARAAPAVLVSCFECACSRIWAEAPLAAEATQVLETARAFRAGGAIESLRSAALAERVRTKLTVIRGFAQLLRRRLHRNQPRTNCTELDRISDAILELDSLLTGFEDASRDGA